MKNKSQFSCLTLKLILFIVLIVSGGTVFGITGYLLTNIAGITNTTDIIDVTNVENHKENIENIKQIDKQEDQKSVRNVDFEKAILEDSHLSYFLKTQTEAGIVPGIGQERSIIFGDLTEDGAEEAIVPISFGGTAGDIAYVVFSYKKNELLNLCYNLDVYQVFLEVRNNKLVERTSNFIEGDADCCPSFYKYKYFKYNGEKNKLEIEKEEIVNTETGEIIKFDCFKKNGNEAPGCFMKIAEKTQDLSICGRIGVNRFTDALDTSKSERIKEECYLKVAKIKKDETICERSGNFFSKEFYTEFYAGCYYDFAIIKQDSTLCGKIKTNNFYMGETKDNCYMEIAVIKQDPKICEEIQDDIYKSWCSKKIQKQKFTPEEVACGFFHNYIFGLLQSSSKSNEEYQTINEYESVSTTEEYRQRINEMEGLHYDPVIFAQDTPDEGIVIEKATIQNDTASLCVILEYSGSESGSHRLIVELAIVDGQWKISDINHSF
ncbi:MAG: hypothetical protein U9N04_05035 [Patescibacteria group bacterium]|nr:hypothetical protein [Patescibacteria group bacterium]